MYHHYRMMSYKKCSVVSQNFELYLLITCPTLCDLLRMAPSCILLASCIMASRRREGKGVIPGVKVLRVGLLSEAALQASAASLSDTIKSSGAASMRAT